MIIGLIPARLNSTRLPNKPLLNIEGYPLVMHVYSRAKLAKKYKKSQTKGDIIANRRSKKRRK